MENSLLSNLKLIDETLFRSRCRRECAKLKLLYNAFLFDLNVYFELPMLLDASPLRSNKNREYRSQYSHYNSLYIYRSHTDILL